MISVCILPYGALVATPAVSRRRANFQKASERVLENRLIRLVRKQMSRWR
jgi:hypothetical protein